MKQYLNPALTRALQVITNHCGKGDANGQIALKKIEMGGSSNWVGLFPSIWNIDTFFLSMLRSQSSFNIVASLTSDKLKHGWYFPSQIVPRGISFHTFLSTSAWHPSEMISLGYFNIDSHMHNLEFCVWDSAQLVFLKSKYQYITLQSSALWDLPKWPNGW